MISAVVFDLGGVLASGEEVYTAPARLLGVDPSVIEELYWTDRRAYDEGGTEAAYWGPILTALGRPRAPETIQQLAALDADVWLKLRPTAHDLLRAVRRAGRTVAVFSNAPFPLDLGLLNAPFVDDADYWFMSASMGVTKPHPASYDRVQEVLELEGRSIAFVDDRTANVDGALRAGWQAHLWTSDADTRDWLRSLGVLG